MNCLLSTCQAQERAPLPMEERGVRQPPAVRDRQAAVQYLRAASLSTHRPERELLRRRAAELVLPWPPGRARWPC